MVKGWTNPPFCYILSLQNSLFQSIYMVYPPILSLLQNITYIQKKPNPYRIRLEEAATYSPT